MRNETSIVIVTFLIVFMGLVSSMPSELVNIGYTSTISTLPDEFDAWDLLPSDYSMENQIVSGSMVEYDFTSVLNTTFRLVVAWNSFYSPSDISILWSVKPVVEYFPVMEYFEPHSFDNVTLLTHWNSNDNYSFIQFSSTTKKVDGMFIDPNATRNDINLAFIEGTINCTIYIPSNYDIGERISARDIITSLLSFRLPDVFVNMPPVLSFTITAMIYIMLSFVFFSVIIQLLHGGG